MTNETKEELILFISRRNGKERVLASVSAIRGKGDTPTWEKTKNNAVVFSYKGIERYRGPAEPNAFYYLRTILSDREP
ncbi:MAG TPA: hypothetical protein VFS39_03520 [Nitrospira sp.]|nr:hypothetical protein [Nitrospira sp.]